MHLSGPLAAYFSAKGVPPEVGLPPPPFPPVPPFPFPPPAADNEATCIAQCQQRFGITCIGDLGPLTCACIKACKATGGKVGPFPGLEQVGPVLVAVLGIFLILIALALITR